MTPKAPETDREAAIDHGLSWPFYDDTIEDFLCDHDIAQDDRRALIRCVQAAAFLRAQRPSAEHERFRIALDEIAAEQSATSATAAADRFQQIARDALSAADPLPATPPSDAPERDAAEVLKRVRAGSLHMATAIACAAFDKADAALAADVDGLREALETFARCELTDDNCASMEVATRRIRAIARAALAARAQDAAVGRITVFDLAQEVGVKCGDMVAALREASIHATANQEIDRDTANMMRGYFLRSVAPAGVTEAHHWIGEDMLSERTRVETDTGRIVARIRRDTLSHEWAWMQEWYVDEASARAAVERKFPSAALSPMEAKKGVGA